MATVTISFLVVPQVANAEVRANAAQILTAVFPLRSESADLKENDELLQKQFDHLQVGFIFSERKRETDRERDRQRERERQTERERI